MYNGKLVVYTSGTFDMFHSNHLKMIEYAFGLTGKGEKNGGGELNSRR